MKKQILFVSILSFCFAATVWAGGAEDRLLIDAIHKNDPKAARVALDAGANVNQHLINGNTPLHLAALHPIKGETIELITLLVTHGARVDAKNTAGQFPIDFARDKRDEPGFRNVQELLSFGSCPVCYEPINPDDHFVRGDSAFECDPRHMFHEKCLIDPRTDLPVTACPLCRSTRGKHVARAGRSGLMAHYTAPEPRPETISVLPETETHTVADPRVFLCAAQNGNLAQVQAQLDANIDVNVRDLTGNTALMLAIMGEHLEIINALLAHADIHVNDHDNARYTALMWAVLSKHLAIVNALLVHPNIDVNARNPGDVTALIYASFDGNLEIVNALLGHRDRSGNLDVDVNAHNQDGNTALICAASRGHLEIVNALLAHPGIDVNARNINGPTALDVVGTNIDIKRALIAHGARHAHKLPWRSRILRFFSTKKD